MNSTSDASGAFTTETASAFGIFSLSEPGTAASGISESYGLSLPSRSTAARSVPLLSGTLGADIFRVTPGQQLTVVSGQGNIDFGRGQRDTLDLSDLRFSQVELDLATASQGGVAFNPGDGLRLFDAVMLANGSQILFEGIDTLKFADRTLDLFVEPNDPLFGDQWNLHMMGVHNAWRFTTGADDILIGIQDTGLALPSGFLHNDLRTTQILGQQFRDESFFTGYNHGTAVQSIIAANSNNGYLMSGINWNSTVLNIDVLGGNRGDLQLATATRAMIREAERFDQQLVINLSLGIPFSFGQVFDDEFKTVVRDNSDVLFVIAAGNDGDLGQEGLSDPAVLAATYDNVIAVGAAWGRQDRLGREREPGDRITYPGIWGSQYGEGLTLLGPSEVIAADTSFFGFGTQPNFNGTSAATPHVTGVASLVWSTNPQLKATEVKQILSQTAFDVGSTGYDRFTGDGVVNADAAVRQALAYARVA